MHLIQSRKMICFQRDRMWSLFGVEYFRWIPQEIIAEEVPDSSPLPLTSQCRQLWWRMNPDVSPGSVTYRLSGPWASSVSFQSLHSLICKMLSASYDCNVHRYLALSMLPINVSDYYMYWHPWKELEVICNETQIYNKKKRINIL